MTLPRHIYYFLISLFLTSCTSASKDVEKKDKSITFEVQSLFEDERFPNIVVTKNGTLIATWGSQHIRARRSLDGGRTWGPAISIANPGFQGGGTTVDETTGGVLVFVEDDHPIAPLTLYRSKDQGQTWQKDTTMISPNRLGHIPSMHMNEKGITLRNGKFAGRLIRPSRYYDRGNDRAYWDDHYTNAIYSDDHGKSWQTSEPFPAKGTGEAAIVELSNGDLYYNSRRHKSTDGLTPRRRYQAFSRDGGQTWEDLSVIKELPDGDQNRDYGLMGGLTRLPSEKKDTLLFSNIESPKGRHHGTVWASVDGGQTWPIKKLIEQGSFAYSSMVAGRTGTKTEGFIYLFYESDGGGKVARFTWEWLVNQE